MPENSIDAAADAAVRRGRSARMRPLICVAIVLLTGCSSDRDYDAAVRTNSVAALDDYLRLHPDGTHAAEVRGRLAALVEDREWQRARAANTSDAYQQLPARLRDRGARARRARCDRRPQHSDPAELPRRQRPPCRPIPVRQPRRPRKARSCANRRRRRRPSRAGHRCRRRPRAPAGTPVAAPPAAAAGEVRIQLGAFLAPSFSRPPMRGNGCGRGTRSLPAMSRCWSRRKPPMGATSSVCRSAASRATARPRPAQHWLRRTMRASSHSRQAAPRPDATAAKQGRQFLTQSVSRAAAAGPM